MRTVFYGFLRVAGGHPVIEWLCTQTTVRCFASLAALPRRSPGGKGAKPPINAATSTPASNHANHPSWAGSARPAHLARPRLPARAAYLSPILPRKMGHLRKACQFSGRNLPSIGMAARIGRPKSPAGFACRGYHLLRPVGATSALCAERGSLRGGRSPPRTHSACGKFHL